MKSKKFIYISAGVLSFMLLIVALTYLLSQPEWPAALEKYHKSYCAHYSGVQYNHAMSDSANLTRKCELAGCQPNFLGGSGDNETIECLPKSTK